MALCCCTHCCALQMALCCCTHCSAAHHSACVLCAPRVHLSTPGLPPLPSPPFPSRALQIFRAQVCDVSVNTLTLEVTGREEKMVALKEVLEPHGELLGWVGGALGGAG